MPEIKLVSFELCPFVQRSVIMLNQKGVDFEVDSIDLKKKPDWFLNISPLGKVPVLIIDEQDALFESAIINEYLDETHPPRLLSEDPLTRAQERGWIEVSSFLLGLLHTTMIAADEKEFKDGLVALNERLVGLENKMALPFFFGDRFSLVDAALAPFSIRLKFLQEHFAPEGLGLFPKLDDYHNRITLLEAVKKSMPEDFEQKMLDYFRHLPNSYLGRKVAFPSTVFRN